MPFHVLVQFDVPSDKREAFARAAEVDARESLASEPGTLRFDVIRDALNRNRFYLDEVYESEAAFTAHCGNAPFLNFFTEIDAYASGPVVLFKGHRLNT
ncbi:putative quinol monooxygenase [Burkholderia sp. Ac-20379]|uniref:putative quinol monooxygenase n=1 Tax=Burkholderia sp. Ac-20379 TaxID=2703900 RepID=UPI00197FF504|nr:putative quinol monooxygenase [Burkholderia sp. Ac-20379]MBN3724629.1 antibiotic biosynthesis monooxygenase [Burkholderia sp. Ac-20379]